MPLIASFAAVGLSAPVEPDCALDVEAFVTHQNHVVPEHDLVEIRRDEQRRRRRCDALRRRILGSNIVGRLRGDRFRRQLDLRPSRIVRLEITDAELPDAGHVVGAG